MTDPALHPYCVSHLPTMASNNCESALNDENSIYTFEAMRRKLSGLQQNYKNVIQGIGIPFRRKNSNNYKGPNEDVQSSHALLYGETIEMDHLQHLELAERLGQGHDFLPQQLTNPTWCDKCGDFIWGVFKQCLKCKYCQYTCHHRCRPLVSLDCTSVSDDGRPCIRESPSLQESLEELSGSSDKIGSDANDETDSGYRSGTIPEEKLPRIKSQETLNREELEKRIQQYNELIAGANFSLEDENGESFQGFLRVTLNLVRPISMSLGARPPSIYEVLTKEHIVDQNTQNISFYMPRDTVKVIHVSSKTTTREVISSLLKKFRILDHPRKFAMYEQELKNNRIAKIRRVQDKEYPMHACLSWDLDNLQNHRLVLQENETGEIVWDQFSFPELNNFMKVLDREENECITQLQYKYKVMKRLIKQRLKEIKAERLKGSKPDKMVAKKETKSEINCDSGS